LPFNWNPEKRVHPKSLPTLGAVLARLSPNRIGGETEDHEWPERAKRTLW
jgi:hypothetical protein